MALQLSTGVSFAAGAARFEPTCGLPPHCAGHCERKKKQKTINIFVVMMGRHVEGVQQPVGDPTSFIFTRLTEVFLPAFSDWQVGLRWYLCCFGGL